MSSSRVNVGAVFSLPPVMFTSLTPSRSDTMLGITPQNSKADYRDDRMSAQPATAAAVAPSTLVLLRDDVDGIAVLTLNQPQSRNSLSEAMLQALGDALSSIAHHDT